MQLDFRTQRSGAMPKRKVHAEELRKIGFPEKVIQEAVKAESLGLFDMEPSPDLVKRTIERCKKKGLFRKKSRGLVRRLVEKILWR